MKRVARVLLFIIGGLVVLCLVVGGVSTLSNRTLPAPPQPANQLDPLDKQRLIEAIHLRQSLGDSVWPGFGQADIPVIVWNRNDSFLVDLPAAPAGWETVSGDEFQGQAYFHQKTVDPQNFAVSVDGVEAASMATKGETDAFLIETFHNFLPPVVRTIFPYRLMIQPSEVQISAVSHESFHVFQQYHAAQRLAAAEVAHKLGDAYWAADPVMTDDWIQEIDLLYQAVRAGLDEEAAGLASQFLQHREARREKANLSSELVDYERQLEWEEGLAKYIELAVWQAASQNTGYVPLLMDDLNFKSYRTFDSRFSQELSQMKRQAKQEGETRLYYTGMAMGFLLDCLDPGWKDQAFEDGVWVEDLLGQAVASPVN